MRLYGYTFLMFAAKYSPCDEAFISAPSYEEAKAFVISEGVDEKDFMLIKSDE